MMNYIIRVGTLVCDHCVRVRSLSILVEKKTSTKKTTKDILSDRPPICKGIKAKYCVKK